jgi:hypothetical protein
MAGLRIKVFFVAVQCLRYLVESIGHGYTADKRGNGVFHAEAITALLPAPKPQPAILELIDATSLLRALANTVYLPRPWYVHSLISAKPVHRRDGSCELVKVSSLPSPHGPSRETRNCKLFLVVAF